VSAEQQISAAYLATGSDDLDRIDLEMLREAAVTLFNQYLSDKVEMHNITVLWQSSFGLCSPHGLQGGESRRCSGALGQDLTRAPGGESRRCSGALGQDLTRAPGG